MENRFLGKQVEYPQEYAPDMLVAVPRYLNREQYDLDEKNLPFIGVDTWHAYELSFLTENGLPVTGLLKLTYSATNPSIVESKSLKLYLNSFNMHRFGANSKEGLDLVLSTIKKDLSKLLETNVEVYFYQKESHDKLYDFSTFEFLEELPNVDQIKFKHFTETPELLGNPISFKASSTQQVATNLLRSNCKITKQPDWGSAFIHIKGKQLPEKENLLQYLVSVRNENHFHEEICEMIYKRLWDIFQPEELMVSCIYTRRGGIDICPTRASHINLLPKNLCNPKVLTLKLLRQ